MSKRLVGALLCALVIGLYAVDRPPTAVADSWQNPDRSLTVQTAGSVQPGDSIQLGLAGYVANSKVQLAVCAGSVLDMLGSWSHGTDWCTGLSPVAIGSDGAASVTYVVPELALGLFGSCMFQVLSVPLNGRCTVVSFEGSPLRPSTGVDLNIAGPGTASISGTVVNGITGNAVPGSSVQVCGVGPDRRCGDLAAPDGSFHGVGMPGGRYEVVANGDGSTNVMEVEVVDGQTLSGLMIAVAADGDTSGVIGSSGATVAVDPTQPGHDQPLTIRGAGLVPGATVSAGLCGAVYPRFGETGIELSRGWDADACASVPTIVGADGTAEVVIGYEPETRFLATDCSVTTCYAFMVDSAVGGRGAWRAFDFQVGAASASISGELSMVGGVPIAMRSVTLCGPVGCVTDPSLDSPQFRFDDLPDGVYRIDASTMIGGRIFSTMKTVVIAGQSSVLDLDIELGTGAPTGSIDGRVLDLTGDPIASASVMVCKEAVSGGSCADNRFVTSAVDGTFVMPFVDDGSYRVTANAFGHQSSVVTTTVTGGSTVSVDLTVPVDIGGGSIKGTVRDLTGNALGGSSVNACRQNELGVCLPGGTFSTLSRQDGTYELAQLPDGTYMVSVGAGGTFTQQALVVKVLDGKQVESGDVTVPVLPGGAKVEGRLVDEGGDPVPAYGVRLCRVAPSTDWCASGSTIWSNSDPFGTGAINFSDMPDGEYRLSAYGRNFMGYGYASVTVAGATTSVGDVVLPVDFGVGSIKGSVTDLNAIPINAGIVACEQTTLDCFSSSSSSGDGAFRIENLPDGTYDLTVTFGGAVVRSNGVVVEGGATVAGQDLVVPVTTRAISGTVIDEQGAGVAGAAIWVCHQSTFECSNTFTKDDGSFLVGAYTDGLFTVEAYRADLGRTSTSAVISGGLTSGVVVAFSRLDPVPEGVTIGHVTGETGTTATGPIYRTVATPISIDACSSGSGSYTLDFPGDAGDASGPLTEAPAGTYSAEIPPDPDRAGQGTLTITVDCPTGPDVAVTVDVYIDPSGFVRDTGGAPIAGATVTLLRADSAEGPFATVPDGSTQMSPLNRSNPDTTADNGHFGWDVVAGYYKVTASKAGCHAPGDASTDTVETQVYAVPPPVVDIDLRLDCSPVAEDTTAPTGTVTVDPAPNAAGWNRGDVTAILNAVDDAAGSGVVRVSLDGDEVEGSTTSTDVTAEGTTTLPWTAADAAGNVAEGSATVRIDQTLPTITLSGALEDGSALQVGATTTASFSCADSGSGIQSCEGTVAHGAPLDTSTPGRHEVTVTATDVAGNVATATGAYTVVEASDRSPRVSVSAQGRTSSIDGEGVVPDGSFRLAVDADGILTELNGTAAVPGTDGRYQVTAQVNRVFIWTFGTLQVTDRRSGRSVNGHVLFGPLVPVAVDGTESTVSLHGEEVRFYRWLPYLTTVDLTVTVPRSG